MWHKGAGIRALARALGSGYSHLHADVQASAEAGLLDVTGGGVQAEYGMTGTKIAI